MANINEFKSRLRGGGARANQFKVTLPFPGYASVGGETSDLAFLCSATALPGQTVGQVAIPFRGRVLNIAGDRTFEPWTITVLNDTDFKLYRAFERWMNGINNMTDNEGIANPADYQVDGFVDQLDRNGTTLKSYTYRGLYPEALANIPLSYSANDAIETFDVTFRYQYFETDTTT
ncbi:hypothetical protein N9R51_00425 [Candidatus Pelagibacter sp.]|jgi:hypothetical protein|nr:hypothetical protein [Candidatus Pelagibacter sp.]